MSPATVGYLLLAYNHHTLPPGLKVNGLNVLPSGTGWLVISQANDGASVRQFGIMYEPLIIMAAAAWGILSSACSALSDAAPGKMLPSALSASSRSTAAT